MITNTTIAKEVLDIVIQDEAKQVLKYIDKKNVIRATRRGPLDRRSNAIEVLITFGPPNFEERANLKAGRVIVGQVVTKY